jgi:hypothetical protein
LCIFFCCLHALLGRAPHHNQVRSWRIIGVRGLIAACCCHHTLGDATIPCLILV